MATKEYVTTYSGANPVQDADPITGSQPDIDDLVDVTRSSQVEALRDKLQAVAKMAGDSASTPAPAGSLAEILDRDHTNGDARQLRLRERAADPTNEADRGFIYTKDASGVTELFFIDSAGNVRQLTPSAAPGSHASSHQNGGGDEISVAGLSGLLADDQNPTSHASDHQSGGGDPIKLDDLATPDDNTDLDASLTEHGLLPKLGGGTTNFLRADGTWAAPPGGFDAYEEEFTASAGSNEFTLSTTPAVNSNTLSGRNILGVFRNGVRSRYQSSLAGANEYNQSGGNDKVNVISQSGGEIFTVVFGV